MPVPKSFIKSVAIEIAGEHAFENSPFPSQEDVPGSENKIKNHRPPFFGRHKQKSKFLEFLRNKSQKGVFLVTGFRGMGKTSFVNKVIEEYKADNKSIIPVHLTITQNQPKEIDILRLMVNAVFDSYIKFRYDEKIAVPQAILEILPFKVRKIIVSKIEKLPKLHKRKYLKNILSSIFFFNLSLFILASIFHQSNTFRDLFNAVSLNGIINIRLIKVLFFLPIILIPPIYLYQSYSDTSEQLKNNAYNRIHRLIKRCHASLSEEKTNNNEAALEHKGFKIKLFSTIQKSVLTFPIATTKEIEYELRYFLKLANAEGLKFIFVFDELDKVDPAISNLYYDEADGQGKSSSIETYQKSLRDRKQAIINIISSLKTFLPKQKHVLFLLQVGRCLMPH